MGKNATLAKEATRLRPDSMGATREGTREGERHGRVVKGSRRESGKNISETDKWDLS